MTDSSQQQNSFPESFTQPSEIPDVLSPKKSNNSKWIIGGVIGFLLLICICVALCVAVGGTGFAKVFQEREPVQAVISEFMQEMESKNTDKAYALFSARVQRQLDISEIEKMIEGNNFVLFQGYQSVEILNLNISQAFNTDQNLPQGTVATVDGTISYDGGFIGQFNAVLEKEDDIWRLHNINITVPPDKFSP